MWFVIGSPRYLKSATFIRTSLFIHLFITSLLSISRTISVFCSVPQEGSGQGPEKQQKDFLYSVKQEGALGLILQPKKTQKKLGTLPHGSFQSTFLAVSWRIFVNLWFSLVFLGPVCGRYRQSTADICHSLPRTWLTCPNTSLAQASDPETKSNLAHFSFVLATLDLVFVPRISPCPTSHHFCSQTNTVVELVDKVRQRSAFLGGGAEHGYHPRTFVSPACTSLACSMVVCSSKA